LVDELYKSLIPNSVKARSLRNELYVDRQTDRQKPEFLKTYL
jgi:hypothetical protein